MYPQRPYLILGNPLSHPEDTDRTNWTRASARSNQESEARGPGAGSGARRAGTGTSLPRSQVPRDLLNRLPRWDKNSSRLPAKLEANRMVNLPPLDID